MPVPHSHQNKHGAGITTDELQGLSGERLTLSVLFL